MVISRIFVLCLLFQRVCSEAGKENESFAASVAGMVSLLETERQLLSAVENYANFMEEKLRILRSAIAEMRIETQKSQKNPEEYLSNPINSYAVMRRMHEDWIKWELFLNSSVGASEIRKINELRAELPSNNDLSEASAGIYRLQIIYYLKPDDMAAGFINGKQYEAHLSAADCYRIGDYLLTAKQYQQSEIWLNTSLKLYQESTITDVMHFDRIKIFEMYSQTLLRQDRLTDAMNSINSALHLSPKNVELLRIKSEIAKKIKASEEAPQNHDILFERCCRGEFTNRPSRLHCLYNTTTTAFLKIAPLKMEILNLSPYIILYHDVLSDNEITTLKAMAGPVLKRAKVYDKIDKKELQVNRRTSKLSTFDDNTNDVTKRVNQRIRDMSGFDLNGAERLQVMNYGLGGHYDPHYDAYNFTGQPAEVIWKDGIWRQGDRISTVLFYLSTVEQGGATVFPYLKTAVHPEKGNAILWYNLNNHGLLDWQTLHGACPVIMGSKWIMTKWIHEYNQMFRRPCLKS